MWPFNICLYTMSCVIIIYVSSCIIQYIFIYISFLCYPIYFGYLGDGPIWFITKKWTFDNTIILMDLVASKLLKIQIPFQASKLCHISQPLLYKRWSLYTRDLIIRFWRRHECTQNNKIVYPITQLHHTYIVGFRSNFF